MRSAKSPSGAFLPEMAVASLCYVLASFVTFKIISPIQDIFFPQFSSRASLLFLPHGVRVATAWLLGWRAVPALLPGVFIVFAFIAGPATLQPSRLAAIAIAVTAAPLAFWMASQLGWDIRPQADRMPCFGCVMILGAISSVMTSVPTNLVMGSQTEEFVAYFIGDMSGMFFLMLILMFAFRTLRKHGV